MISPSTIQIIVDGDDITQQCLYQATTFKAVANAVPGDFQIGVRDDDHSYTPRVMSEVAFVIDDVPYFGGIAKVRSRQHFFPVEDSTDPMQVKRNWVLKGPDFNTYFDFRVLRDPDNYLRPLPTLDNERLDLNVLKLLDYIDVPDGMFTSGVERVANNYERGLFPHQGSKWREAMDELAEYGGAIYYMDAFKGLNFRSFEESTSFWGFTDYRPDGENFIGFREGTFTESALELITEALVWGGSALHQEGTDPGTGPAIGTVFAKYPDPPVKTATWAGFTQTAAREQLAVDRLGLYGRWQRAEMRVGQEGYLTQGSVKNRAYTIVAGPPGIDPLRRTDGGYNVPQPSISLSWFAHDVPSGAHIVPGTLVPITLYTMGSDLHHPVVLLLPLRSVKVTFPTLPSNNPDGDPLTFVRFDGEFGLSMTDSRFLWKYLLKKNRKLVDQIRSVASNNSASVVSGSDGRFFPNEAPDASRTDFSIPFGYWSGTTQVYINGLLQQPGVHYYELDAGEGTIRFITPPYADDRIEVIVKTNQG